MLTACGPEINPGEVSQHLKDYLSKKYDKEFEVTNIKRGCTGFGAGCVNEARGIAYAKDNPEVKFEVTHDLKTKEDTDTYHIDFWSHQIKKEFNEDIKQSIQANPDYILVYVEKDRLDPQEFPYWQDVLPH